MVFPAGRQYRRQVTVAGPVDLLDPGPQPVNRSSSFGIAVMPPSRRRSRLITIIGRFVGNNLGQLPGDRGDLAVDAVDRVDGSGVVAKDRSDGIEPSAQRVGATAEAGD